MTALFVTGSGTEIGKTYVTEMLIRRYRAEGQGVRALKPVISGFDPDNASDSDTGRLLAALGRAMTPAEIEAISPWRFAAPLSPDMAAAREGRAVPFDEIVGFCRRAIAAAGAAREVLLIEGVGGVMVPLDDRRTVLDLIAALGTPALVVGGSYLGALSHTLTAVAVLRQRGVRIERIAVSETPGSAVPLDETRATLARFVAPIPVETVPFSPAPSPSG